MDINQFRHVLRAAAGITGETVFVVVGSQAALVQFPHMPEEMAVSAELDIFPRDHPELAELIDGSIGADSAFHATFGYYADGVAPETARLPGSWQSRAVTLAASSQTGGAIAICPEIHDLAVSKLLAGRQKDIEWLQAAVAAAIVQPSQMEPLLDDVEATSQEIAVAMGRLQRLKVPAG